jgi:hypothetical protein
MNNLCVILLEIKVLVGHMPSISSFEWWAFFEKFDKVSFEPHV